MADWNPGSPEAWARALGMLAVPLFGRSRQEGHPGAHSILLDGEVSSFTLAVGGGSATPAELRLSWAWSSNVTYSFVVDAERRVLLVQRWDEPGRVEEYPIRDEGEATEVVNSLSEKPSPDAATVIDRALHIFRIVRSNIEERGGTHTDLIRTFNALLIWSDVIRWEGGPIRPDGKPTSLGEILEIIEALGLLVDYKEYITNDVLYLAIDDLVSELLATTPGTGYPLEPRLLIRHAAGDVYQEAHREISPSRYYQHTLFPTASMQASPSRKVSRRDVHFTPSWLARALAQEAIRALSEIRELPRRIEVLDPACGSGVFLVEALRELSTIPGKEAVLRGIDDSEVSCIMTEFCLQHTAMDDVGHAALALIDTVRTNSLKLESWGKSDLILMNPPFVSWGDMDKAQRAVVKSVLGSRYKGRADTSLAFISRAIDSLKPGAALATIAPASILDSRAAEGLRAAVKEKGLTISLIGRFRGFEFFSDATVEPVFLLISRGVEERGEQAESVRFLVANKGSEDRAIRALRKEGAEGAKAGEGWEILEVSADRLSPESWTPRTRGMLPHLRPRSEVSHPTIGDLFEVHLGIRVGNKKAFMLSAAEFNDLAPSESERRFFRPTADTIRAGRIIETSYIFYPYGPDGILALQDEDELRQAVPTYYQRRLASYRNILSTRDLDGKPWWSLARQRPSWLPGSHPKIVTPAFGRSGNFAYDQSGMYAVVQGVAWFWRGRAFEETLLPFAYVALLNSPFFESLLDSYCPQVRGGQYELYKKNVDPIPLPNLWGVSGEGGEIIDELAEMGRSLTEGIAIDMGGLDRAALAAYKLPPSRFLPPPSQVQARKNNYLFKRLADKWKSETGHLSNIHNIIEHPAYQRIIAMGEPAIPLILADLRRSPYDWFPALVIITDENPVREEFAGVAEEMARAWIDWGRGRGYIK